jgi:chromate transporter
LNYLVQIFWVCFKLGVVGFGGPAAHIALMRQELVEKRKWLSESHFLDLMGFTNLIPGPNSTEMIMHCGRERGGVLGLFAAGIAFITPAVILTGLLASFYVEFGDNPWVAKFLKGLTPAVFIFILGATLKLGQKALKNKMLYGIGILALILSFLGLSEILVLALCSLGYFLFQQMDKKPDLKSLMPLGLMGSLTPIVSSLTTTTLFLKFLKIGGILYGSGYVLFAFVEGEFVTPGYLSYQQLAEAIGIGQVTPGPVLSTATFIGYQLLGWKGALLATLGIFLPSFLYVLFLGPHLHRWAQNKTIRVILDGVNASAVALIAVVLIQLGSTELMGWMPLAHTAVLGLIYFYKKWTNPFLILGLSTLLAFIY